MARKGFRYTALAFSALIILGVVGVSLAYAAIDPEPPVNADVEAQGTQIFWAPEPGKKEGELMAALGSKRTIIPLSEVPVHVRDAVIAAEDHTFYENPGISFRGILRALRNNASGGDKQGASTITQQYVKNVHLTSERKISRKAHEVLLAIKIDRHKHKDEILAGYLNTIYWGRGAEGIEAASQAYFDVPAHKLSIEQGAFLAGIIRSPGMYNPTRRPKAAEERWNIVMDLMVKHGKITPERRAKAKYPKSVKHGSQPGENKENGYIVKTVRAELAGKGYDERDVDKGGLRVYTTLRKSDHVAATKAVEEFERKLTPQQRKEVRVGLASVNPRNGEVIAMYGGNDPYGAQSFNAATQAKKQAGSTFKPFTLAAALQDGENLKERKWVGKGPLVVPDGENGEKKITNLIEDGSMDADGLISLMEATQNSVNTAYVDVTRSIGTDKVKEAMEAAGLRRPAVQVEETPTMTLGTAAVSPMTLATAYATFANEGKRPKWHVVRLLRNFKGEELYRGPVDDRASVREFEPDVAAGVTFALQNVVQNGTGQRAKIGRPTAGKTGTHEGISAWYVGYTPESSTAVNVYREAEKAGKVTELPLKNIGQRGPFTGGNFPAKIWAAFTRSHLSGRPVQPFPQPSPDHWPADVPDPREEEKDEDQDENEEGEGGEPTGEPDPVPSVLPSPGPSQILPTPTPSPSTSAPPEGGGNDGEGGDFKPGRRKPPLPDDDFTVDPRLP